jgi:hypothetical protein
MADNKSLIVPNDATSMTSAMTQAKWSREHENILVDWADKALCYRWMHEKSHLKYSRQNTWFTIPVIIMSTLTGTANFAQDRIPAEYLNLATMVIGGVNLIAGILTTISQYLKVSELNEAYRVSAIAWGKFYRNIRVELAKHPDERTPVFELLKHSKEEFDRLIETSPSLSNDVIKQFISTFSGGTIKYDEHGNRMPMNMKQTEFEKLHKPEICDSIETLATSVYIPEPLPPKTVYLEKATVDLRAVQEQEQREVIEAFIQQFQQLKKRLPTLDEIDMNIGTDHNIERTFISRVLNDIATRGHVFGLDDDRVSAV